MYLRYLLGFFLMCCILVAQAQDQHNATINATDTQVKVPKKQIMLRKLHEDDKQGEGMVHIVIHKIQPGDPYYKVFDGDEKAARGFTNKIWNRLLNRYSTMII
nr:uncharacterized protein LOC108058991 [Drosophila takahashii]